VYGSLQSAHSSHGHRDVADEVSSEIWQALDLLAKKHPGDEGVWLALELRDRLKAHYERLKAEILLRSGDSDAWVKSVHLGLQPPGSRAVDTRRGRGDASLVAMMDGLGALTADERASSGMSAVRLKRGRDVTLRLLGAIY
jgi:hypothetical protein